MKDRHPHGPEKAEKVWRESAGPGEGTGIQRYLIGAMWSLGGRISLTLQDVSAKT